MHLSTRAVVPFSILMGFVLLAWLIVWMVRAPRSPVESVERMDEARRLYSAAEFAAARAVLAPVVATPQPPVEALRGMAELEYLLGNYPAAEDLLRRTVAASGTDLETRADAEVALAFVYYQTNAYAESAELFAGLADAIELPVWTLMKSFGKRSPYRVDWNGQETARLPFVQTAAWELPRLTITVNGRTMDAKLDTGGDLLTIPTAIAEELGIEPVAKFEGTFAGGATGEVGYGRVDLVGLGSITVQDVPVAVGQFEHAVIGTGLLRQFLPTVDYLGGALVLQPRQAAGPTAGVVRVPFALALTHLMVVEGGLDATGQLTFIVDSGLEDMGGAALAVPQGTLGLAGIPEPSTTPERGQSGAGEVTLHIGRFPVQRLAIGPVELIDTSGLSGVFPPGISKETIGFSIHGLISHNFLRGYAWTIDFDEMEMTFTR